jgi:hypothetical protein
MADGLFYNDLREPHFISDLSPVTLSTTAKALYTTSDVPSMAGYFLRARQEDSHPVVREDHDGANPRQRLFRRLLGERHGRERDDSGVVSSIGTQRIANESLVGNGDRGSLHHQRLCGRSPLPRNLERERRCASLDSSARNDTGLGQR